MNGKTTILLSGLVAILMVTCAVPFMASEDSDALTGHSNLNLNATSAVLYISPNSPDHSFTFTVMDAPEGTQASAIQWYFVDLEDGLNIASFNDSNNPQTFQNGGFSATVYAKSIAAGKTASSIEVVAYIDSTHYASAVVVVYPSESTTTTVFHYYFKIDEDAIDYLIEDEQIEYEDIIFPDLPQGYDLYDGFWVTVTLNDTGMTASQFNALSALQWYLDENDWENDFGYYGWINTLLGLGSYMGPANGDGYVWYYWAQYHATGNGSSATWVFNNTTLEFITTAEESYIGMIFWGSPDANSSPDFPGYPTA
jgi:hypothetical protein